MICFMVPDAKWSIVKKTYQSTQWSLYFLLDYISYRLSQGFSVDIVVPPKIAKSIIECATWLELEQHQYNAKLKYRD